MKSFLSAADCERLRIAHKRERDRRVADRIKAVLLKDKGWSHRAIAEALLLDEETVSQHIKDYLESAKLKPANGGSSGKLDALCKAELVAHLASHTYMKVSDICAYVKATYGVEFSVPGMTQWLHAQGFSYKKPKGTPAKADRARQAAFVVFYKELQKSTPQEEPILFGDGVHPTMATKLGYGWIRKGSDKLIATTASRTRLNIMGSLNLETMDIGVSCHETLDSEAMGVHFQQLREAYPHAPKIHLILDRGPYNTSLQTREAAQAKGIVLHYLSPYSPTLNPIERVWKVMNEQVRNNRFFASAAAFREAISVFFNVTWSKIAHTLTDQINDNFRIVTSVPSI